MAHLREDREDYGSRGADRYELVDSERRERGHQHDHEHGGDHAVVAQEVSDEHRRPGAEHQPGALGEDSDAQVEHQHVVDLNAAGALLHHVTRAHALLRHEEEPRERADHRGYGDDRDLGQEEVPREHEDHQGDRHDERHELERVAALVIRNFSRGGVDIDEDQADQAEPQAERQGMRELHVGEERHHDGGRDEERRPEGGGVERSPEDHRLARRELPLPVIGDAVTEDDYRRDIEYRREERPGDGAPEHALPAVPDAAVDAGAVAVLPGVRHEAEEADRDKEQDHVHGPKDHAGEPALAVAGRDSDGDEHCPDARDGEGLVPDGSAHALEDEKSGSPDAGGACVAEDNGKIRKIFFKIDPGGLEDHENKKKDAVSNAKHRI